MFLKVDFDHIVVVVVVVVVVVIVVVVVVVVVTGVGSRGARGACAPPHFCLGGQWYVCAPPLLTPHFHLN